MGHTIDNLLNKGMHSDNPEELQPKDTYRYSINGEVVHFAGDMWKWKPIKGTTVSFTMCSGFHPIGGCQLRDRIIIFSIKSTLGQIGEVRMSDDGTGTYYSLVTSTLLNFNDDHPIEKECYGIYENTALRKVYWTDNYNSPRSLNLELVQQVAIASLITGVTYAVTCGTITQTLIAVPHTITTISEGTIFVADTSTYTYTGTGKVNTYVPIASFDQYPENTLADFYVQEPIAGTLLGGTYYFCWQQYDDNGAFTEWSYLAGPVPVYNKLMTTGDITDYQTVMGKEHDVNTAVGIRIRLENINTNYNHIKVATVHSTDENIMDVGVIFIDQLITSSIQTFDLMAYIGIPLTISAIVLQGITITKCKTMTNDKYIAEIGNITEEAELDPNWTPSGAVITETKYELPVIGWDSSYAHINASLTGPTEIGVCPKTNVVPDGFPFSGWWAIYTPAKVTSDCVGWLYPNFWYKVIGPPGNQFEHPVTNNAGIPGVPNIIPPSGELWIQGFAINDGGPSGNERPIGVWRPIDGVVTDYIFTPYIRKKTYMDHLGVQQYKNIAINNDWLDFKGMIIGSELKHYWAGETYRFAFIGLKRGKPKYARFLGDFTFAKRDNGTTNRQLVNNSFTNVSNANGTASLFRNIQTGGIEINGLDLTGIIDDIDGFMIVRCVRDKQYLHEGYLANVLDEGLWGGLPNYFMANSLYSYDNFGWGLAKRRGFYYSPDVMLDTRVFLPQLGDKLEVMRCLLAEYEVTQSDPDINLDKMGLCEKAWARVSGEGLYHNYYQVFCKSCVGPVVVGTLDDIDDYGVVGFGANMASVLPGEYITNISSVDPSIHGIGCEAIYIKQKTTPYLTPYIANEIGFISLKRPNTNLYGGSTEQEKAMNEYIYCGHYQRVDATFRTAIGITNIVNHLEVFGGDSFLTMFDFVRITPDYSPGINPYITNSPFSHGMIFPIQSNSNPSLRIGLHTLCAEGTKKSGGLINYGDPGGSILENFEEEKAYSTDESGKDYPALPYPFLYLTQNVFDARMRWTLKKVLGETLDSFRFFPVLQFKDLETKSGPIYNLRGLGGRIYYWQDSGVGYLPIGERTMISSTGNVPIQMGTGGELDRFDEIIHEVGNQHSNGLVSIDGGFMWIDFKRRMILKMTLSFGKEEIQLIKGVQVEMDSLNILIGTGEKVSHPTTPLGIIGIYDPHNKRVYFSCVYNAMVQQSIVITNKTFSVDTIQNAFNSYYSFEPSWGIYYYRHFLTSPLNSNVGWLHGNGVQSNFYGSDYDAIIDIIINPATKEAKVFDIHNMFGVTNRFFDELTYSNSVQTAIDTIYDVSGNKINRNYEYRNNKWQWNTALSTTGRMRDIYLKIRMKVLSTTKTVVSLIGLTTNFRITK